MSEGHCFQREKGSPRQNIYKCLFHEVIDFKQEETHYWEKKGRYELVTGFKGTGVFLWNGVFKKKTIQLIRFLWKGLLYLIRKERCHETFVS